MVTVIAMSYRDDQDAALARADALQVELDRSRGELERAKSTLAEREAELADSERERETIAARLPAALPVAPALLAEPAPDAKPGTHPAIILGIVALGVAGTVALVTSVRAAKEREQVEQQKAFERYIEHSDIGAGTLRSCTVNTIPSGAEVVSVDDAGATYSMGMTPFSRSIGGWSPHGEHLETRLDGYQPVTLTEPEMNWHTSACEATITLVPLSGR
jgi:hypothetical protein